MLSSGPRDFVIVEKIFFSTLGLVGGNKKIGSLERTEFEIFHRNVVIITKRMFLPLELLTLSWYAFRAVT